MSDSAPLSAPLSGPHPFEGKQGYRLSSDLARLSLPAEYKDAYRTLAWVNSICFLFLLIGIVGLRPPKAHIREIAPVQEIVPVVFTPPEEVPKPQVEAKEEEPEPQDTPVEAPQIVTIVAPSDAKVAFAVPVEGAVAVAQEVRYASPPPPANKAPVAAPTVFRPGNEAGTFPWPKTYPRDALAKRLQGTTMLYVEVDATGVPSKVEVKTSSRYSELDDFAVAWVKKNWRWQPGEVRLHYVPFEFKLQ